MDVIGTESMSSTGDLDHALSVSKLFVENTVVAQQTGAIIQNQIIATAISIIQRLRGSLEAVLSQFPTVTGPATPASAVMPLPSTPPTMEEYLKMDCFLVVCPKGPDYLKRFSNEEIRGKPDVIQDLLIHQDADGLFEPDLWVRFSGRRVIHIVDKKQKRMIYDHNLVLQTRCRRVLEQDAAEKASAKQKDAPEETGAKRAKLAS